MRYERDTFASGRPRISTPDTSPKKSLGAKGDDQGSEFPMYCTCACREQFMVLMTIQVLCECHSTSVVHRDGNFGFDMNRYNWKQAA